MPGDLNLPPDLGQLLPGSGAGAMDGVDESTWLDVIQKMDEVYSQLVRDEVALEQKNAELEQSHQFIFSVLSAMSDVLLVCDAQGRIVETNAALCELVGQGEAALHQRRVHELLLPGSAGAERLAQVLATPALQRGGTVVEVELLDGQGQAVPVDLNITPRCDPRGRRVGLVLVGRPMAELKRAYQQLHQAHEALKRTQQQLLHSEKMASLGRLVAGVAHELNNPISFVLGNVHALGKYSQRLRQYLDALHAGTPVDEALKLRAKLRIDHLLNDLPSLMEGTMEGAQRTADIVQGLTRFSAIDREQRVPTDLNGVVERAIHWVSKGTAPQFSVHWAPGAPLWVLGNAGQLLQVLMNLIQNGHDATAGVAQPALWIEAAADAAAGTVQLTVRDNGPGIAPEHLSRVFEPFFTTKPVGAGTGLGLSISYGIVEQHGGQLTVANAAGGGALFTLTLPAAPVPGAAAA